ncbi:M23 family metallopeptidase [Microbacterium oxydans]|uniref:M23 family metallopeptidase n=1 Tax=Microbacterium TaxID=33882 RepID=UPI00187D406B|nr:M23 family metallopeptidase [Microbacterium sp. R1]MBE7954984.1 M23 family metallopeptidase [Microbacterium sp. R1]
MTAAAITAAVTAAGVGAVGRPQSAAAAVTWGYPFTFRSGRSRGFVGQYPAHAGIDYTPGLGTPIHAVADGTIVISGITGNKGAYGESIHIQHADGYRTVYAHMLEGTRIGTGPVSRGQFIGKVGDTGQSTGPHLHIEVQRNGVALNPDPYIDDAPLAGSGPTTPQQETAMEAIVKVPTGAVVHLRYGGKTDFASQQQYNDFRMQVDTLRSLGATDLMPLPELSKVPGVSWDTFTFLACYIGAPTA